MALELRRHLGEEITIHCDGVTKPITLKISKVANDLVFIRCEDDAQIQVDKVLPINNRIYKTKNTKLVRRTPIEERIFYNFGKEFQELLIDYSLKNMTLRQVATEINVVYDLVYKYAKKYKVSFKKATAGWILFERKKRLS